MEWENPWGPPCDMLKLVKYGDLLGPRVLLLYPMVIMIIIMYICIYIYIYSICIQNAYSSNSISAIFQFQAGRNVHSYMKKKYRHGGPGGAAFCPGMMSGPFGFVVDPVAGMMRSVPVSVPPQVVGVWISDWEKVIKTTMWDPPLIFVGL